MAVAGSNALKFPEGGEPRFGSVAVTENLAVAQEDPVPVRKGEATAEVTVPCPGPPR